MLHDLPVGMHSTSILQKTWCDNSVNFIILISCWKNISVDSHGADWVNGCSYIADQVAPELLDYLTFHIKKDPLCSPAMLFAVLSSCMTFVELKWNSPAGRNTHSCSTSKPNVSCVTHAIDSFLVAPRQLQTKAALRMMRCETRTLPTGLVVDDVVQGEENPFFIALIIIWLTHHKTRNDDSQLSSLMITLTLFVAFVWTRRLFLESIYWESLLTFRERFLSLLR